MTFVMGGAGRTDESVDDAELVSALMEYVPEVLRVNRTPGLGVALARGGRVIWEQGFGVADMATGRPMTAEMTLRSGSMGKVYTATAAMQLVQRGELALDAAINDYLTTFQVTNSLGARPITVRDLLTHRSGLAGNSGGCNLAAPPPLGEHLAAVYGKGINDFYHGSLGPMWSRPVGEQFEYSNTGITNPRTTRASRTASPNIGIPTWRRPPTASPAVGRWCRRAGAISTATRGRPATSPPSTTPPIRAMATPVTPPSSGPPSGADAAVTDFARRRATLLESTDPGGAPADLASLRSIVGDARVVEIGESLHGGREFGRLRHRTARFLIEEMGFTVVCFESGLVESAVVDDYISGADIAEAAVGMASPTASDTWRR